MARWQRLHAESDQFQSPAPAISTGVHVRRLPLGCLNREQGNHYALSVAFSLSICGHYCRGPRSCPVHLPTYQPIYQLPTYSLQPIIINQTPITTQPYSHTALPPKQIVTLYPIYLPTYLYVLVGGRRTICVRWPGHKAHLMSSRVLSSQCTPVES